MSILDKIKDKAEQLIGEAKEKIGQMTANGSTENAGNHNQLPGETKEAGRDLHDKAAGDTHDTKEEFGGGSK
ncbi:MAG TPA: CsbD family protein [Pseudonocardiaceae bacterium]|nr:CsbD family protein [Pseudonocardiaceae bacterium]